MGGRDRGARHHLSVDEELAAPDAERLAALEGAGEAQPTDRAAAQIAFARAASAGFSEKNNGVYVERGSAHRAALAITASTGSGERPIDSGAFATTCTVVPPH